MCKLLAHGASLIGYSWCERSSGAALYCQESSVDRSNECRLAPEGGGASQQEGLPGDPFSALARTA